MILAKYEKQPLEVEGYSIQFADDMTYSDSISSAWQKIVRLNDVSGTITAVSSYTASLADDKKCIHASANITLPANAPNGYTQYVANLHQSNAIIVSGAVVINVRGAAVIVCENGLWMVEAATDALIVSVPNDHHMRTFVREGKDKTTYKIDMLVTTVEGRTMQDEVLVKVKES